MIPAAQARLENPDAVLSRRDLAELGYPRTVVDAIFRACPTVNITARKPLILVRDYRALVESRTFDGKTRVRP